MATHTMTSRERVLAALNHKEPDRTPFDLGGSIGACISITACQSLYRYLGVSEQARVLHERGKLARLSEAVAEQLGSDTRAILTRGATDAVGQPDENGVFTDEWGVVRAMGSEDGYYNVVRPPLDGEFTRETIRTQSKQWPDPADPSLVEGLADEALRLHEETQCATVVNLPISILHQAQFLRGFEKWLLDLVREPMLSGYLLDLLVEHWLERARRIITSVGRNVDVLLFGDDLGHEKSPLISPKMYRALLKPYHKRIFDALRQWSDAKIVFHSDGNVFPLIDDLIEIGADALNPIQVSASDMGKTGLLKARFGDRIAFWGGIDTQHVLPFGTPAEVRAEVCRRIADLGCGGGYVMAPSSTLIGQIPPENICAMCEAPREFRGAESSLTLSAK